MSMSYKSCCFYLALLLVKSFLLPLIPPVPIRVLKEKAMSVEGDEYC